MAKKKERQAAPGIGEASAAEISEALYFARKCGLTPEEALRIMREAAVSSAVKTAAGEKQKH